MLCPFERLAGILSEWCVVQVDQYPCGQAIAEREREAAWP